MLNSLFIYEYPTSNAKTMVHVPREGVREREEERNANVCVCVCCISEVDVKLCTCIICHVS